ncbi:hypothetical protein CBM2606_A40334 [Cupriavidus taiwanensis]|nr:hypothetical protein CBM2606_A40334 [Cupriavidus taiwanensis]
MCAPSPACGRGEQTAEFEKALTCKNARNLRAFPFSA